MRLPKRGERGFTLIELLIVVAILGVLAAVVIPNVTRFVGAGETEAAETELHNIQLAVTSMMLENGITTIPNAKDLAVEATNDMKIFPDSETLGTARNLLEGHALFATPADDGYVLYGHQMAVDKLLDDGIVDTVEPVNYVVADFSEYSYTCAMDGTVTQQ